MLNAPTRQPVRAKLEDRGGWVQSLADYGFLAGSANAAQNDVLMATLLEKYYQAGGVTLIDDIPGWKYLNQRLVIPNSNGGSTGLGAGVVGAIGSPVPTQPPFRLLSSRLPSTSGQQFGGFILNYVSPNPTSASYVGPVAAGTSKVFSGLTIPQGTFDIGCPITINDGTMQETSTVSAITVSGGLITSFTLDALVLSYGSAITLSWPILNDAPILSLGDGDLYIYGVPFQTTNVGSQMHFILCTNTRPHVDICEFRGAHGPSVYPGAIYLNDYPSGGGVLIGGPRAANDGSPSSGSAGYTGWQEANRFFSLEHCITHQSLVTTQHVQGNYITSSCGSRSNIGAAVKSWTAAGPANNSTTYLSNQTEIVQYANTFRFGNNTQQFFVAGNQHPDNVLSRNLASTSLVNAATLSLNGWVPIVSLAPFLQSYNWCIETGDRSDLVRFTAMAPASTTSLSVAVLAGATTVQVPVNTGLTGATPSAPVGILLSSDGTYGIGSSANVMEPAWVTGISGTGPYTLTLSHPLALAHSSGVGVQVGPFTATVQNTATLVNAHSLNALVSPVTSAVRLDVGAQFHHVFMGGTNAGKSVYDLNPGIVNNSWPSRTANEHNTIFNPTQIFPILMDHVMTGRTKPAPTVAVAAGMGTTGTATLDANATDACGEITFVTGGTGIAAGNYATVTFGTAYPSGVIPRVFLQARDTAGFGPTLLVGSRTNTGFTIYSNTTPLAAGGTFYMSYWVVVPGVVPYTA